MNKEKSFANINRRLAKLEASVRPPTPVDASPSRKVPRTGLDVRQIVGRGNHFIGWAWYPTPEEIEAMRAGGMVCFTECASGHAFVSIEGCDPRPLPAFPDDDSLARKHGGGGIRNPPNHGVVAPPGQPLLSRASQAARSPEEERG